MNSHKKRTSTIAVLSSAAALAVFLAATVPVTPAYAVYIDPEDCVGSCPDTTEGPDVSNPEPEASEPDYGSERGAQSEPPGDSESETGGVGEGTTW